MFTSRQMDKEVAVNRHNGIFSSVQFSRSVVSDYLWPYEPKYARPPYPWPTPGVHPNSCPASRWSHPAISSCVVPFFSCPQSLPASESFPMSQLFAWDGQSTGVSASTSVLPVNTQDWSPLGWTVWISLQSKGLSRAFSNTKFKSINFYSGIKNNTFDSVPMKWMKLKPITQSEVSQKKKCQYSILMQIYGI